MQKPPKSKWWFETTTRTLRVAVVCAALLAANGCKVYTWSGVSIPPDVKTATVELFQNTAPIVSPQLGQLLTEKIRDKFQVNTGLRLLSQDGDYQVSGEIINYTISPIAVSSADQTAKNRLEIGVRVRFVSVKRPEEGWTETISRFADFGSAVPLSTVETQLQADIADQLSQDIFNKITSNW
jgi:hypothetical protein